ncbi:MAG: NAD(P)-dependent oxidoreductase [Pirellulaceae bacterium]
MKQIEDRLSEPWRSTAERLGGIEGDIVVLGAGGKMGPTLAMLLKRAAPDKEVYAVSRFSDSAVKTRLEEAGILTVACDLLNDTSYSKLPDVRNVYYLAGMKFGASGKQTLTWAMNAYMPALVAKHYRRARIAVFSTGNVYPFSDTSTAGPTEQTDPDPVGEYAWSCLARERIFEYFSREHGTEVVLVRLNYSNEPRYGIIVDLTRKVMEGIPIDLTMGHVNLIYQADANNYIAQGLPLAKTPPAVLNVAGPDVLSVRGLATRIGEKLGRTPSFTGSEARTALLSDASSCVEKFGPPRKPLDSMLEEIVEWVASGKETLAKPTKYDVRDGKF